MQPQSPPPRSQAPRAQFDRAIDDVGNVVAFEHVNLTVEDQQVAALFYVTGLGGTRDPYIDFGTFNMWVNVGEQQFHLPKNRSQHWRGHIGFAVPSLQELTERLERLKRALKDSQFGFAPKDGYLQVTCPWGNEIRCYEGHESGMSLGIPYVEMFVPEGTAEAIARFYRRVLGAPASVQRGVAVVSMGRCQQVRFRETSGDIPTYDGHHIAIYVSSFSSPHGWLAARELISEESDAHQYRFQAIVDPDTGALLTELEHEVRSLHHPMYNRPLVNRNAANGFMNYRRGHEVFVP
jgi:hypothetical protein